MSPDRLVFITIGGVLGATTRWLMTENLPSGTLAWGMLAANTLGSLLLGVIAATALHPERRHNRLILSAEAGFCGSFTTFSTLAVSVAGELHSGSISTGALRLIVSVVAGLGAAFAGWRLAEWSIHHDEQAVEPA